MYVFYILYFIEVIQLKHRNTLKYIFQILDPPHNLKAMYASTLHKPRREPTWHRKCVCVAPTYCFTNLPVPIFHSFTGKTYFKTFDLPFTKLITVGLGRDGFKMRPSIWVGLICVCNNLSFFFIFWVFFNFDIKRYQF